MPAEPLDRVAPVRSMVIWCDDWPVAAMGARPTDQAAVVFANRVVAGTPAARTAGVQVGQRRREAQSRCPDLVVHERDEAREARAFEPVLRAVEVFTPRLELTRPGACTFATRGPARYFGGDEALAAQVVDRVDATLEPLGWQGAARVGVADGPFAATIAAQAGTGRLIVPAGATPAFLAPLPISVLDPPELTEVLARLGLRTLGEFAALGATDVVARFGAVGRLAHRLAQGLDERPPDAREPPPDLVVRTELDPPADRIDQAAFVAKSLADELFDLLAARGLSCTRVVIGAETEHGEAVERLWRYEGSFTAGAITDRVRWQLEGWLHRDRGRPNQPTGGISVLRLAPDEVVPAHGRQLGFWGGESEADVRAVRALARVQGLLGPEAVRVPEWRGGRGPAEQLVLVPASTVDLTAERPSARAAWVTAPWPGRLPSPSPAVIHPDPLPVEVLDASSLPVTVDGRARVSAAPAWVGRPDPAGAREPDPSGDVVAWAGPWPADERWWDPRTRRRRARFQVLLADGTAHLLTLESGHWTLEATFD